VIIIHLLLFGEVYYSLTWDEEMSFSDRVIVPGLHQSSSGNAQCNLFRLWFGPGFLSGRKKKFAFRRGFFVRAWEIPGIFGFNCCKYNRITSIRISFEVLLLASLQGNLDAKTNNRLQSAYNSAITLLTFAYIIYKKIKSFSTNSAGI